MKRLCLVIGGGSIAKRHIRNLQCLEGIEVFACTRHGEFNESLSIETYESLHDALNRRPDVAVIGNITSEHIPTAMAAAECGCDIFIEKPLSQSLQGVEKLFELKQKKNLVVMIGCNMRFHPALHAMKQALDEGRIGGILSAAVHCGSYLPDWRPHRDYRACYSAHVKEGGGVVLDLIHELDYLHWFFGDVECVAAFLGKRSALEIESEDLADILLRFRSGLVAQVHLDYVQRTPSRGCRLIGEEGTIVWGEEGSRVVLNRPPATEELLWAQPQGCDNNAMYEAEIKHFLDCVETRKRPTITLEDGITVLHTALAAKTSAQEQRVVFL